MAPSSPPHQSAITSRSHMPSQCPYTTQICQAGMLRGRWAQPGPSLAKPWWATQPLRSGRWPGLGAPLLGPDWEGRPESLGRTSTKTRERRSLRDRSE